MNRTDNCTNCFMPLNGQRNCPSCGYDSQIKEKIPAALSPFCLLKNRYVIGRVLGSGGFGITYKALDLKTQTICAIKEFMPSDYAQRKGGSFDVRPLSDDRSKYIFEKGRERFLEEAQSLFLLKNIPRVVQYKDSFNLNNTAYLVMEYLDGSDLQTLARQANGVLPPEMLDPIFVSVAKTLADVHKKGMLHRDISPDNIILTRDRQAVLIDFGAAKSYVNSFSHGLSVILKRNYSPPEQFDRHGDQGPWSDVYSLCSTYYRLTTGVHVGSNGEGGVKPLSQMNVGVRPEMSAAIEKGLQADPRKRFQNFIELLEAIGEADKPPTPPKPTPPKPTPPKPPRPPKPPINDPPKPEPPKPPRSPMPSINDPPKSEPPKPKPEPPKPKSLTKVPAPARFSYEIILQSEGKTVRKCLLADGEALTIGREPNNRFVVDTDGSVSRSHCVLRAAEGKLFLKDVSSYGTFFDNGERLTKGREYEFMGNSFYLVRPQVKILVKKNDKEIR